VHVVPSDWIFNLRHHQLPEIQSLSTQFLHIMSTSWLLEEDTLLIILTLIIAWFGAIVYFIPVRQHLYLKAATTAQRSATQRSGDPNLIGMQCW
jgi:hypothetical protein